MHTVAQASVHLLNPTRFNLLIHAGITSFQISLDGPKEQHDKTRVRADGEGTFKKIWQNLLSMAKTDHEFEVILRIHVTPENHDQIYELLDNIKFYFKYDSRFKIFLKAIANLGGPNQDAFKILKGKTKQEVMEKLHAFIDHDLTQHQLTKPGLPYICYASAQNAWVIRANGRLAKCTVAFDDERNNIGRIKEDGSLELDQEKIQLWLRGLKAQDANVMGCPAYQLPQLNREKFNNIPIIVK